MRNSFILAVAMTFCSAGAAEAASAPVRASPLPVKVLVINLFGLEAAPWLAALRPTEDTPTRRPH
jgi:purine nucleoside permease